MDLPKGQSLISRQVEVFQVRKSSNGNKYKQAEEAIEKSLQKCSTWHCLTAEEKY
jgi:hypothetical protein